MMFSQVAIVIFFTRTWWSLIVQSFISAYFHLLPSQGIFEKNDEKFSSLEKLYNLQFRFCWNAIVFHAIVRAFRRHESPKHPVRDAFWKRHYRKIWELFNNFLSFSFLLQYNSSYYISIHLKFTLEKWAAVKG